WEPEPAPVDLVTASFFQPSVALDRTAILRRAATAIRSGRHLVIVSHPAPPSWATDHQRGLVGPGEAAPQLARPGDEGGVQRAEDRSRAATAPDGSAGEHLDAAVLLRRR